MIKALLNQRISATSVKIIKELYTNLKAKTVTDKEGSHFPIEKGGEQGDSLSPHLFNCVSEEV